MIINTVGEGGVADSSLGVFVVVDNAPVSGALVYLTSGDNVLSGTTNSTGYVNFGEISPGVWTVEYTDVSSSTLYKEMVEFSTNGTKVILGNNVAKVDTVQKLIYFSDIDEFGSDASNQYILGYQK